LRERQSKACFNWTETIKCFPKHKQGLYIVIEMLTSIKHRQDLPQLYKVNNCDYFSASHIAFPRNASLFLTASPVALNVW